MGGAPYIARRHGQFCAGNAVSGLGDVGATLPSPSVLTLSDVSPEKPVMSPERTLDYMGCGNSGFPTGLTPPQQQEALPMETPEEPLAEAETWEAALSETKTLEAPLAEAKTTEAAPEEPETQQTFVETPLVRSPQVSSLSAKQEARPPTPPSSPKQIVAAVSPDIPKAQVPAPHPDPCADKAKPADHDTFNPYWRNFSCIFL